MSIAASASVKTPAGPEPPAAARSFAMIASRRSGSSPMASSLSDWSLADRGMERRFALREPATGR